MSELLDWLLSPVAIRARAEQLYAHVAAGKSAYFTLDAGRLEAAADYVAEVIRANYPSLKIPYHARWRHFGDRWDKLAPRFQGIHPDELARIRFDLAVVSVLLDAGAGAAWKYEEPGTGQMLARSEGLAVASLHAFQKGVFSRLPEALPCRADAEGLERIATEDIAQAFQVTADNPLDGLEGRTKLLRDLGAALRKSPDYFGRADEVPRIGFLFDHLKAQARDGVLPADAILKALLRGLGPVWPGRIEFEGVNLGDCWRHAAATAPDASNGLVPFHKLSQWLAYSLVEPLEEAGIRVADLDALTGLPEYRNGGLFLDLGVLRLKDPALAAERLPPAHEAVVEWRALTVALLDRLADPLRRRLGKTRAELPLASLLEGGTWAAGRRIAAERRPGGPPPLNIISDGTVF
ncbi:URC4/urg3 family protein [Ferrovibrio sp. MS7]|uniref:URC4/urg3 family protein n=1 Tax=Ferrovibrio plantarum TaxID=3119164 RepID=UPI0031351F8C